jgi:hypothetical protein
MSYTDAIRQVAAWLENETLGVNALLPSVPMADDDEALPSVRIFAATEQDWVARSMIDRAKLEDGPAVLVSAFPTAEATIYAGGKPASGQLTIAVRYAARKTASSILQRQGWQTMRACMRSLVKQATQQGVVREHDVRIGPLEGLTHITALEDLGDDLLIDILTVTLTVDDAWACGGTPT